MTVVQTQLSPDAKAQIVEVLNQSLAETAVETMKAQNFHWNVEGMAFGPLHDLFQEIYEDHFEAQDDLAERIRALDAYVDGRMQDFTDRSKVDEAKGRQTDVEMIKSLLEDQQTLSATLIALAETSDRAGDQVTNDLAVERAQKHDKFAWKLRAHLGPR